MTRPATQRIVAVLVIGLLLFVWELAVAWGWLRVYQFPPPSRIADGLREMVTTGFPTGITIWSHTLTTLWRILQGYAAAVALAIPVGLVIGAFPTLDRLTAPVVVFCRSVATLSLLPLAIVWFGAGELTKVC